MTVIMDADGDLQLKVGTDSEAEEVLFQVCPYALRRSSLVFNKMLFGPWAESRPQDGDWIVSLPEDHPRPTRIALAIIHGKFEIVPRYWGNRVVEELIIFTDKYDMNHILRPWGMSLMETISNKLKGPHNYPTKVHISWVIGLKETFVSIANEIILAASVDPAGDLRLELEGGTAINLSTREHFGPLDMIDIITRTRLDLIQSILNFFHSELDCLTHESPACLITSDLKKIRNVKRDYDSIFEMYGIPQPITRKTCDNTILGSIWRQLLAEKPGHGNLPTAASEFLGSADHLLQMINKMFKGVECHPNHIECSPFGRFESFETDIRSNRSWSQNWLTESHERRLEEHRLKLGI
ncbi:hypothetical protein QBC43DRAFT_306575 [Cladorrhinum sp. PSN259]|nr:hypothetical protein QBC43DRAFT_306575 [Cladorrhinum sp. PSN259]